MNGEYLLYLQEIKDTEWVIELISEQFDDAMNMMTPNSIIYGGAVRDCLAGKNLIGDLDIAVSASEGTNMVNKFVKNPKWVNISGNSKRYEGHYKKFSASAPFFDALPRRSMPKIAPQIMTFKTLGNKTVQIVILPQTNDDPFQTVTTMVKQVDIVCCGIILTNDNKVFEVIPNAYKDCKKHVLHLNNACYVKDIEHFKQHIEKLSERGWINEININKVIRAVNRKRKQKIEQKKTLAEITKCTSTGLESHTHTIKRSDFVDSNNKDTKIENGYIVLGDPYTLEEGAMGSEKNYGYAAGADILTHTGYRSVLSNSDIGYAGGLSEALYSLEAIAKKYRLDMIVQPVRNCIVVITKDRYTGNQVHDRMIKKAKRFKTTEPLVNKKLEGTIPVPKMSSYGHQEAIAKAYTELEAKASKTYTKLEAKTSKKSNPSRTTVHVPKSINKQSLWELDEKKEFSVSRGTKVEKHFNYSTNTKKFVPPTTNRYYRGISKSEIIKVGGISVMLSGLERLAKKFKVDIGIVMERGNATIITKDDYTSKHIYELLLDDNSRASKYNTSRVKSNTESSGDVTW